MMDFLCRDAGVEGSGVYQAMSSLWKSVEQLGHGNYVPVGCRELELSQTKLKKYCLPALTAKQKNEVWQRGPDEYASELDALLPETHHPMVRRVIDGRLPAYELERLKEIERIEHECRLQAIGRTS
ncbi:hypothetical protein [Roseovarius aquimarinus]|uniref:Uncharacterized protein n=1 Tax=Roseovarius aquimarinus TaxID=1229156 RepID=A0ABW7I667_9RHOB